MKANQRQVAGDHYQNKVQHWDIVDMYKLDYLIGNATKYLLRFGKKGTVYDHLNDLNKSLHYIQKRIEQLEVEIEIREEIEATQHVNTVND